MSDDDGYIDMCAIPKSTIVRRTSVQPIGQATRP